MEKSVRKDKTRVKGQRLMGIGQGQRLMVAILYRVIKSCLSEKKTFWAKAFLKWPEFSDLWRMTVWSSGVSLSSPGFPCFWSWLPPGWLTFRLNHFSRFTRTKISPSIDQWSWLCWRWVGVHRGVTSFSSVSLTGCLLTPPLPFHSRFFPLYKGEELKHQNF